MNEKIYISQLTFPRFIAASLVVIFHYGSDSYPFNTGFIQKIISEGSIAVSFFFFLSGLVLSVNYFRDTGLKYGNFLIKRIARIYPIYLFGFIITLFLAMLIKGAYPKGISAILQLLSLHAWKPGICLEINYPGWSISVEIFFYLLLPLFIYIFRKISLTQITLIVLSVWVISIIQNLYFETHFYNPDSIIFGELILYFPLWHLNTFLFGMLSGIIFLNYKGRFLKNSQLPFLLFLIGIVILLLILGTDNIIRPHIHNGLLSPVYLMITLGLAFDHTLFSRFLGRKELVYLGDISYSIYILQFPVYLVFIWFLNLENVNGWYFYIYFIFLMIVCAFTYKFIEQKFRRLITGRWV